MSAEKFRIELNELVNDIGKSFGPYLIYKTDPYEVLVGNHPELYRALGILRYRLGMATKAALQLQTAWDDCFALYIFAERYPWRGRVSRSDHLRLTWNMYEHCCYVLSEGVFLFLNRLKKLDKILDNENYEIDFKQVKTCINLAIGDRIRSRGTNTHDFKLDPPEISHLQMIELLESMKVRQDSIEHYYDSKFTIRYKIKVTNEKIYNLIKNDLADHWSQLLQALNKFNRICELALNPETVNQIKLKPFDI